MADEPDATIAVTVSETKPQSAPLPAPKPGGMVETLSRALDPTQPFGLPEGTVRAAVFLIVTTGLMTFFWRDKWAPPSLESAFNVMLGFYFGARSTK
jgi:hypothetical protein